MAAAYLLAPVRSPPFAFVKSRAATTTLRAVRGKRPCRLHAKPSRNARVRESAYRADSRQAKTSSVVDVAPLSLRHCLFSLCRPVRVPSWQPLLTSHADLDKTESVSECLDNRRLSPVTSFFMPTKRLPTSPRKQRTDAQRNRQRILEVAKEAFTRYGANTSLDDIAKDARGRSGNPVPSLWDARCPSRSVYYHTEVDKAGRGRTLQALRKLPSR